ncbi:MAG: N-acetylmuramoyl-L-alanine amidase, partial [Coprothermobacter proteolyticus]
MGRAKVRKILSILLVLVLLSVGTVQGETWSSALIVTQINAKQLYIVTNGFTSYKLDGNTVTFSSKWNGGSMETGVFQVTANPWLSVKSSAPFTIKMLSPREFLISAIDESAVVLPNVDVDVHT